MVLLVYPISENKEQSSTPAMDPIGSAQARTLIVHIGRPVELGVTCPVW